MSFIKSGLTPLSLVGAIATIASAASPLHAQTIDTTATPEQPVNFLSLEPNFGTNSGDVLLNTFHFSESWVGPQSATAPISVGLGERTLLLNYNHSFIALEPGLNPFNSSPDNPVNGFSNISETNGLFQMGTFIYSDPGRETQTEAAEFTPFQWRYAASIIPQNFANGAWTDLRQDATQIDLIGPWMDMGVTTDGSQTRFTLPDVQNTIYTFGIDDWWYEFELLGFVPGQTTLGQLQATEQEQLNGLLLDEWVINNPNQQRTGSSVLLTARMSSAQKERNPDAIVLDIAVDGELLPPTEDPQPEEIPEPGLLLGLGAIALGAFRLRRDRP
ncbi:MAG: PEP-CTERM sorting domain-containing protein [Spirulinaceae cyanobacterium]